MSEVGTSEETSKLQSTLEQFTHNKIVEAQSFVFEEGPKEAWGIVYDNWPEIDEKIRDIFSNSAKNDLPTDQLQIAEELFEDLENDQEDVVQLHKSEKLTRFATNITSVQRSLNYLALRAHNNDDLFDDISKTIDRSSGITQICYFLADIEGKRKKNDIQPIDYSCLAAITLRNLGLVYHDILPHKDEYERLQDELNEKINSILQSWFNKGIDFLNITNDVPTDFRERLEDLKHHRNTDISLPFPSGIIGKDLEKLIDEDAFDENELSERTKLLLLCNLRYLLEDVHDTYIDEEFRRVHPQIKLLS